VPPLIASASAATLPESAPPDEGVR
jgi:hypothetical protein